MVYEIERASSNGQMLTVLRFLEQQIINLREKNAVLKRENRLRPVVVLDEGYMFIDPQLRRAAHKERRAFGLVGALDLFDLRNGKIS